ncbi:MAG: putative inner membrane transporter yiJE [Chloroflexi bacterium ADurb.Bin325]|nr:MAG: putative inner membrane transporter yiJE [Chloroflexi bacterium ADurb.Bin325]
MPARSSRQLLADAALLLVTLIWGATFVMVKDAVSAFPVFSFMALRFTLAVAVLVPLVIWRRRQLARAAPSGPFAVLRVNPRRLARLLLPSLLVGSVLFAGYAFQTAGLQLTTPAKTGFITGLSVVFVPIAAALLLRQPPERNAWLGVGLATVGLALLSLTADLRIQVGDLLVMACAVSFAGHILLLGRFAPRHDPLLLTLGQLLGVALLSILAAAVFDRPAALTGQVVFAVAFTGLLATAAAFGIQTVAQRFTTTTHTALIFAAEPVFAGLASFLLTGEVLGPRQLLGCALILVGMVVAELKR